MDNHKNWEYYVNIHTLAHYKLRRLKEKKLIKRKQENEIRKKLRAMAYILKLTNPQINQNKKLKILKTFSDYLKGVYSGNIKFA